MIRSSISDTDALSICIAVLALVAGGALLIAWRATAAADRARESAMRWRNRYENAKTLIDAMRATEQAAAARLARPMAAFDPDRTRSLRTVPTRDAT